MTLLPNIEHVQSVFGEHVGMAFRKGRCCWRSGRESGGYKERNFRDKSKLLNWQQILFLSDYKYETISSLRWWLQYNTHTQFWMKCIGEHFLQWFQKFRVDIEMHSGRNFNDFTRTSKMDIFSQSEVSGTGNKLNFKSFLICVSAI